MKRFLVIFLIIALCMPGAAALGEGTAAGIITGEDEISYAYAQDLLAYGITHGRTEDIFHAQQMFVTLGSHQNSRWFASYADLMNGLFDEVRDLNIASVRVNTLQQIAGNSDVFTEELERLALPSLAELDIYVTACSLYENGQLVMALEQFKQIAAILDASAYADKILTELPAGFDEAWRLERAGKTVEALKKYAEIGLDNEVVLAYYTSLAERCDRAVNADLAVKEKRYLDALNLYYGLAQVDHVGAQNKYNTLLVTAAEYAGKLARDAKTVEEIDQALALYSGLIAEPHAISGLSEQMQAVETAKQAYLAAVQLENTGDRETAQTQYAAIEGYAIAQTAAKRLNNWLDQETKAESLFSRGEYAQALNIYQTLAEAGNQTAKTAQDNAFAELMKMGETAESSNPEQARTYYGICNGFGVSGAQEGYWRASMLCAEKMCQTGDVTGAADMYKQLSEEGYEPAKKAGDKLATQMNIAESAAVLSAKGDYVGAATLYAQLEKEGYVLAAPLLTEATRQLQAQAKAAYDAADFAKAAELYGVLEQYEATENAKLKKEAENREKLESAKKAAEEGNVAEAVTVYRELSGSIAEARELLNAVESDMLSQAELCITKKDYAKALELYASMSSMGFASADKKTTELQVELLEDAEALAERGNYADAYKQYDLLAKLYIPGTAASLENMEKKIATEAITSYNEGDYTTAAALYAYVMDKEWGKQGWHDANMAAAEQAKQSGNIDGAQKLYQMVADVGYTDAEEALTHLNNIKEVIRTAEEHMKNGELEAAIYYYNQLTEQGYTPAATQLETAKQAMYEQAVQAYAAANYELAQKCYGILAGYNYADSAQKSNESGQMIELQAAMSLEAQGDCMGAVAEYRRLQAAGLAQASVQIDAVWNRYYTQIDTLRKQERYTDVYTLCAELEAMGYEQIGSLEADVSRDMKNYLDALKREADSYMQAGQLDDALRLCKEAADKNEGSAREFMNLKINEGRIWMRRAMLSGDEVAARNYHDILEKYSDQIEPCVVVDTGFPLEIGADPLTTYLTLYLNLNYYRESYPDLAELSDEQLTLHWLTAGYKEGRRASPAFDPEYYLEQNPDVAGEVNKLGEKDYALLYGHYLINGIPEGRNGSAEFNALDYLLLNPDLQEAYGNNIYMCFVHYNLTGYQEDNRPSLFGAE